MHKGVKNLQRKGAERGGMDFSEEWVGRSRQALSVESDGFLKDSAKLNAWLCSSLLVTS